jgi:hypothetical protein
VCRSTVLSRRTAFAVAHTAVEDAAAGGVVEEQWRELRAAVSQCAVMADSQPAPFAFQRRRADLDGVELVGFSERFMTHRGIRWLRLLHLAAPGTQHWAVWGTARDARDVLLAPTDTIV